MVRSLQDVFIFCVVLFTCLARGCHVQQHSRRKRQATNLFSIVEDTRQLRDYFTSCMADKASSQQSDWNGVIDYTVLDTNWYFQSDGNVCGSFNDTVACWQNRLEVYLRSTSTIIPPARDCIRQLQEDVAATGIIAYRARPKRQAPVVDASDVLRQQYVTCVHRNITLPPGRRSIDINTVVRFVEDHAICGTCDLGRSSNAIVLAEGQVNNPPATALVSSLSQSYIPTRTATQQNPGIACGSAVYPFILEGLTKQGSPLFGSIVTCNDAYRDQFLPNPCNELINRRSQAFCRSQMAWCESFPEFMRQNCEKTCCERELNVLLDSPPVGWTAWTSWGTCPAPCGQTAVQSRTRTCPLGEVGTPPCTGPATESRVCHPAMVCASWSQWQPWYACSVTCEGVGTFTTRFRTCQGGNSGDRGCEGVDSESQPCGRDVCPEPAWAPWSTWSDCSYKRRTRTCVGGTSCPGESREFTECPCGTCNRGVVRSTWGSWMPWTACSARCGQGFRRRARICGQTGAFFQDCDGSGVQIASCSGSCRPI